MIRAACIGGLICLAAFAAQAQTPRGTWRYANEQQCAAAKTLSAAQCRAASLNAAAEFDEKVPRFATRDACERAMGANRCMIGEFAGSGGVYFVPQRAGFIVTVKSDRDMTVVPVSGARSAQGFRPRTILRLDTARNFGRGGGAGGAGTFGVATPTGEGGPLPPPPKFDPNFDCNALLEPKGRGDDVGCYPVSPGMLQNMRR
jgi:uncharacterized protein YgiB involved in biofilm formation